MKKLNEFMRGLVLLPLLIMANVIGGLVSLPLLIMAHVIAVLALGWVTDNRIFDQGDTLLVLMLSFPLTLLLLLLLVARSYRLFDRSLDWSLTYRSLDWSLTWKDLAFSSPEWKYLGISAAVVVPVAVYLIWDEPAAATTLDLATLAPLAPRAADSHAVALWYTTNPGRPQPRDWSATARDYLAPELKPAEWRAFVMANREAIRADWAAAAPAREWVAALDAFEVVGDTTEPGDENFIDGRRALRDTCFLHCAYASLLAIEGRIDEAMAVLRPMHSVGRKLQPAARSSFRLRLGVYCQRLCENAADFMLRSSSLSADHLRLLESRLAAGSNRAADLRRVFLCNCAINIARDQAWASHRVRAAALMLLYNRNATSNLAIRTYEKLLAVALEGRGEGLRAHEQSVQRDMRRSAFKNVWGRWAVAQTPADFFTRTLAESTAAEDHRRVLLAEVQAKLAAAEKKEAAHSAAPAR